MLILISGIVKFYNTERGVGLIRRNDGKKDVRFFLEVLKTAGLTTIKERQKVRFDTQENPETGKITASHIELD